MFSRILEAIREYGKDIKFYQASTSELYGRMVENPAKKKPHHFIQEVLMGLLNYMDIGLQRITENHMTCSMLVVFCSTMNQNVVV